MKETKEQREERYIKVIQDFYITYGRVPKRRELSNYATVFNKTFGSWNNAIAAAGYKPANRAIPSKTVLKNSILKFYLKNKRTPKASECSSKNKLHDSKSYMKAFGCETWGQVLEKVGLKAYFHVSDLTKEKEKAKREIIKFLQKKNITKVEDYNLLKPKALPSSTYINNNLVSWKNILIEAGLLADLSLNNIKSNVLNFSNTNKRSPSLAELAEILGCDTRSITKVTGTFSNFIEGLGLIPAYPTPAINTLSDSELIELYKTKSIEHGYENGISSRLVKQLTGIGNDIFVARFSTINNLRKLCGFNYIARTRIQYTKENISNLLFQFYLENNRTIPTRKQIADNHTLPSISTIFRHLQTSSIDKVWKEVFKIKIKSLPE